MLFTFKEYLRHDFWTCRDPGQSKITCPDLFCKQGVYFANRYYLYHFEPHSHVHSYKANVETKICLDSIVSRSIPLSDLIALSIGHFKIMAPRWPLNVHQNVPALRVELTSKLSFKTPYLYLTLSREKSQARRKAT